MNEMFVGYHNQRCSHEIKELAVALSKAQSQLKGAHKDATNPFFKSKYADLASIWDAARGPLTSNGLSVVQTTEPYQTGFLVITTLMHESGQFISSSLPIFPPKPDMQWIGSAITYARRYLLSAIVGIAPLDDDAAKTKEGEEESEETKVIEEKVIKATKQQKALVFKLLGELGMKYEDKKIKARMKAITGRDSMTEWTTAEAEKVITELDKALVNKVKKSKKEAA